MSSRYRLTSVDTVEEDGAWLFTVENVRGNKKEIFLTPCEDSDDPIKAWVNNCTHEDQALYREGIGAVTRDGGIVCPKHGSVFDSCSGDCGNGPARDSTLQGVDVTVDDGQVYLTDTDADFLWEGGTSDDDDDDMPSSTSHLSF